MYFSFYVIRNSSQSRIQVNTKKFEYDQRHKTNRFSYFNNSPFFLLFLYIIIIKRDKNRKKITTEDSFFATQYFFWIINLNLILKSKVKIFVRIHDSSCACVKFIVNKYLSWRKTNKNFVYSIFHLFTKCFIVDDTRNNLDNLLCNFYHRYSDFDLLWINNNNFFQCASCTTIKWREYWIKILYCAPYLFEFLIFCCCFLYVWVSVSFVCVKCHRVCSISYHLLNIHIYVCTVSTWDFTCLCL